MNDSSQGLAVKDIVIGTGEEVKVGDMLEVVYTGTIMATGKEFAAAPLGFKVGEGKVLPGLDRGVPGLRVGGTRRLRIPPALAYGDRGALNVIPPKADLEMQVELKRIYPPGPAGEAMMKWGFGNNPKTYGTVGMLFLTIFLPNILAMLNIK
jgi:peptidylprolyl isomerase